MMDLSLVEGMEEVEMNKDKIVYDNCGKVNDDQAVFQSAGRLGI